MIKLQNPHRLETRIFFIVHRRVWGGGLIHKKPSNAEVCIQSTITSFLSGMAHQSCQTKTCPSIRKQNNADKTAHNTRKQVNILQATLPQNYRRACRQLLMSAQVYEALHPNVIHGIVNCQGGKENDFKTNAAIRCTG